MTDAVERCFAIADLFVGTAKARGGVRVFSDADQDAAFQRGGELSRIRNRAEYPRADELLRSGPRKTRQAVEDAAEAINVEKKD